MKKNQPFILLYQDEDIIVVYKNRDVLTVKTDDKKTYNKNLYYYLKKDLLKKDENLYVVHRLDYETSGIIIFAKNMDTFKKIQTSFLERKVKRNYEAIIKERIPLGEEYEIHQLLESSKDKIFISNNGKEAITKFKSINYTQIGTALNIKIETGKRNQIRIALSTCGYTLLGDKRYSKSIEKRMYLNAYKLEFEKDIGLKHNVFETNPLWIIK